MSKITKQTADERFLQNLADALVEDILSMPKGQLVQELIEDGQDPKQIADETRGIILKALAEHEAKTHG